MTAVRVNSEMRFGEGDSPKLKRTKDAGRSLHGVNEIIRGNGKRIPRRGGAHEKGGNKHCKTLLTKTFRNNGPHEKLYCRKSGSDTT